MLAGRWAVRMALKDIYYNDELVDDVLVDEYSRPLNKTGYAKLLGSIREQYFSPEFTRMSQSYGRVRVPVLIVWGNNDKWVPLLNGAKLELSLDDSCLHVIPNAGHLAHQELPDMVNPIIIQFLETD